MTDLGFQRLLERMRRNDIAGPGHLIGCTPEEIETLCRRYGLTLPASYLRYLQWMGHGSGRLFASDHLAVFYPQVLEMTADIRDALREQVAEGRTEASAFDFPDDALIVAGRLGEQFEFIRCNDPQDSPVWYFDTWQWSIRISRPTFLAWLEAWCGYAEDAIKSGYFEQNPRGTRP